MARLPASTRTGSPPVDSFTATSNGIYVNTGSRLVTYSLAGSQVGSFNLPANINPNGNEVTQPVIDPSGMTPDDVNRKAEDWIENEVTHLGSARS